MRFANFVSAIVVGSVIGISIGHFGGRAVGSKATRNNQRTGHIGVNVTLPDAPAATYHSPKPGKLIVDAQAHLVNKVVSETYLWYVEARVEEAMIYRKVYEGQYFTVRKGESAHPTFHDEIDVQPGEYWVHVGLIRESQVTGKRSPSAMVGFGEIVSAARGGD
jgi:hypothetical protein